MEERMKQLTEAGFTPAKAAELVIYETQQRELAVALAKNRDYLARTVLNEEAPEIIREAAEWLSVMLKVGASPDVALTTFAQLKGAQK